MTRYQNNALKNLMHTIARLGITRPIYTFAGPIKSDYLEVKRVIYD